MIHSFIKTSILFFMFICAVKVSAQSLEVTPDMVPIENRPHFSFITKELNIPIVVVDGESQYSVKMNLISDDNDFIFALSEVTALPSFEERFENITDNMSRQEVIDLLGFPQGISDHEMKVYPS